MALSKDQIVVWLSAGQSSNTQQNFLLATPYARAKEISNRLQAAYAKKVRGNRLENLNLQWMTELNAPFVTDYTNNLFRISDLAGFGAVFPIKASQAQTQALNEAAKFLKETFPDCQYMIRYDPKSFRSSVINSWLKKNTLNAKLDPIASEASLELQTSMLLGGLIDDFEYEVNSTAEQIEISRKISANISMSPKWTKKDSSALYLDLFDSDLKGLLQPLFHNYPFVMYEGLAEKWLKKRIDEHYLQIVSKCVKLEGGAELVLETSVNRLESEYQKLKKESARQSYTYDLDEIARWCAVHYQYGETTLPVPLGLSPQEWCRRILKNMDQWIADPLSFKQAPVIYLVAHDEKLAIFTFEGIKISQLLFQKYQRLNEQEAAQEKKAHIQSMIEQFMTVQTAELAQLPAYLEKWSGESLLPVLYSSVALKRSIMKYALLQNRFIPCYVMNGLEKTWIHEFRSALYPELFENREKAENTDQAPEQSTTDIAATDVPAENEQEESIPAVSSDVPQTDEIRSAEPELPPRQLWFKQNIYQQIDPESLEALAKSNLSFSQIRLVGTALARGLRTKVMMNLIKDPEQIYTALAPYLFSTKIQNWFEDLIKQGDQISDLYYHPSLTYSQMNRLFQYEQEGIDPYWLRTNLKGNMTLKQMDALKDLYPFGKLPKEYQVYVPLPSTVAGWMLKEAAQNHPHLSSAQLNLQLEIFNELLFERCILKR